VKAELELKMEKALKETRPEKWGKVQGYNKKAMVSRPPPPLTSSPPLTLHLTSFL